MSVHDVNQSAKPCGVLGLRPEPQQEQHDDSRRVEPVDRIDAHEPPIGVFLPCRRMAEILEVREEDDEARQHEEEIDAAKPLAREVGEYGHAAIAIDSHGHRQVERGNAGGGQSATGLKYSKHPDPRLRNARERAVSSGLLPEKLSVWSRRGRKRGVRDGLLNLSELHHHVPHGGVVLERVHATGPCRSPSASCRRAASRSPA